MTTEQEKRAEQRGYGKGYAAGKRLAAKAPQARHEAQRNAARFDRFMCAAMTGLLASHLRWKTAEKYDSTAADFAGTAAQIAAEMMKKGPKA